MENEILNLERGEIVKNKVVEDSSRNSRDTDERTLSWLDHVRLAVFELIRFRAFEITSCYSTRALEIFHDCGCERTSNFLTRQINGSYSMQNNCVKLGWTLERIVFFFLFSFVWNLYMYWWEIMVHKNIKVWKVWKIVVNFTRIDFLKLGKIWIIRY